MPDVTVTEIIEELERFGVPKARANELAVALIIIGEKAAVYQAETANAVAELLIERQNRKGRAA